jgi:hypothetical protein
MNVNELPKELFPESEFTKLHRHGMGHRQITEVECVASRLKSEMKRLKRELDLMELWAAFQRSDQPLEYTSELKVYEISDDDVKNWVAAKSADEAVEFLWRMYGYESQEAYQKDYVDSEVKQLRPDRGICIAENDDFEKFEIKTAAAWAMSDKSEPFFLAGTEW